MASIFDPKVRRTIAPSTHGESSFQFHQRADGPGWQAVRDWIEQWAGMTGLGESRDWRARFQGADDRGFLGAFWELYVGATLKSVGAEVDIQPPDLRGTSKPDFLVDTGTERFAVEATVAFPASGSELGGPLDRMFVEGLDSRVRHERLMLRVHTVLGAAPPIKKLAAKVQSWLDQLDPALAVLGPGGFEALPCLDLTNSKWGTVLIEAIDLPRPPPNRRGVVAIGRRSEGRWVDTSGPVRRAIEEKAAQHSTLSVPIVVAILSPGYEADQDALIEGALGRAAWIVNFDQPGSTARPTRNSDGAFTDGGRPRRMNVSGVLWGQRIVPSAPASLVERGLTYLEHPWAKTRVLAPRDWSSRTFDFGADEFVPVDRAQNHRKRFGLPPAWPGPAWADDPAAAREEG